MKIQYRYDRCQTEFYETDISPGMVIAEKIDENGKYLQPRSFPHYNFSYVIFEVNSNGVEVRDTGQDNLWFFKESDLNGYELVMDWHPNSDDNVASYVNDVFIKV